MTKQKIFLFIPLIIIAGLLIYSWITFLLMNIIPTWKHYLALGLFIILLIVYFKSPRKATIVTGVYLLLGVFNALAITPIITIHWFQIFGVNTPAFQLLPTVLFILYLFLNFDTLGGMYLDYKESKASKK